MFKSTLLAAIFSTITLAALSQGTIRGVVKDLSTGEPIGFASVKIKNQNKGGVTDFDGSYTIKPVPEGTYTLVFTSFDGYLDMELEDVVVKNRIGENFRTG